MGNNIEVNYRKKGKSTDILITTDSKLEKSFDLLDLKSIKRKQDADSITIMQISKVDNELHIKSLDFKLKRQEDLLIISSNCDIEKVNGDGILICAGSEIRNVNVYGYNKVFSSSIVNSIIKNSIVDESILEYSNVKKSYIYRSDLDHKFVSNVTYNYGFEYKKERINALKTLFYIIIIDFILLFEFLSDKVNKIKNEIIEKLY